MNTSKSITLYVVIVALLASVCLLLNASFTGVDAQPQPRPDSQCRGRATGDPSQVDILNLQDVRVAALPPQIEQTTAYNDCCGGVFSDCEAQYLEALVPKGTADLPARAEADGGLPFRRTFCGIVTKYEVNNEKADPRDININLRPAPGSPYVNFLKGFVKTDQPKLKAEDRRRFGNVNCDRGGCLARASDPELTRQKVIHAEVTPDEHFYGADGRFLPIVGSRSACEPLVLSSHNSLNCVRCIDGARCQSELEAREGQTPRVEACVYGVFAYDHGQHKPSRHTELCCLKGGSHDHPEIHPYDAIWWRHPAMNGWMFGVFQDDSNRYSFPHCRESHSNHNTWSQAPRDLTFEFPFKFPRRTAVQRVCLRHVRTTKLKDGSPNIVRPLNVTTGEFTDPQSEVTRLIIGRERLLELVKEPGSERETHVRIVGGFDGDNVVGRIILRVAVGCDQRTQACGRPTGPRDHRQPIFDRLKQSTNLVQFDKGDPGAGYFYAELTFNCDCR